MARKKINTQVEFPFHISARCINKEWFYLPLPEVWEIMENELFLLHHGFGFLIHSFVLMSNHFHMIARTPDKNLSAGMEYFMRETSRRIAKRSGRINHVYGSRYHKTVIGTPLYYLHAYKYVYRNPVEAGVVSNVTEYPFSTLSGVLGVTKQSIPLVLDETLFNNVESTVRWLNTKPNKDNYQLVKRALRKSEFKLSVIRRNRKKSDLEFVRY